MNRRDLLSEIVHRRTLAIEKLATHQSLADLERSFPAPPGFLFRASLAQPGVRIIAELKKASPSKGVLREHFDVTELAGAYARGGAAAISVLTEPEYFLGDFANLSKAKAASTLPVLCKDFVTSSYHVALARVHGADAILLICRILDPSRLRELLAQATAYGMDVLVEAHSAEECRLATESGAQIIGINARDLQTFTMDMPLVRELRSMIPPSVIAVAESGIRGRSDIVELVNAGYRHFLVGEALMTSNQPEQLLREMIGAGGE